jgi:hypothetical protein
LADPSKTIIIKWDGTVKEIFLSRVNWSTVINISAFEATPGTHTVRAALLQDPYDEDSEDVVIPCPAPLHELYLPLILKTWSAEATPTPTATPGTPTATDTPTALPSTETPTPTPTSTPACEVEIVEPVYEVDTTVTVTGDPGDLIELWDMDAGVLIGTGTVGPGGYCDGSVDIDVNGNLVDGHIIAALSTRYPSFDTACVGVTTCWPTSTPTATATSQARRSSTIVWGSP